MMVTDHLSSAPFVNNEDESGDCGYQSLAFCFSVNVFNMMDNNELVNNHLNVGNVGNVPVNVFMGMHDELVNNMLNVGNSSCAYA